MSYFKAKMHRIRHRLRLRPRPRWGGAYSAPSDPQSVQQYTRTNLQRSVDALQFDQTSAYFKV